MTKSGPLKIHVEATGSAPFAFPVRAIGTRAGAFALPPASLLVIGGGFLLDGWMTTLPSSIPTYCSEPRNCDYRANPAIQLWVGLLVSTLRIGLLLVAWRFDRWPDQRPRQGWKALRYWGAPLLWLAVIPILAAPATFIIANFTVSEPTCKIPVTILGFMWASCPAAVFLPSVLIPGLLNFFPLRWLLRADPRTRIAAIVASLLGMVGLGGAFSALLSLGPTVTWNFGLLLPNLRPSQQADLGFGTMLWLFAIITLLVIAKLPLAGTRFASSQLGKVATLTSATRG